MHDQGNYISQVGKGPYALPPAFQQRPAAAAPPPTSHHGPPAPQPQVIQQGHPSFHLTSGIRAYQHALPSVPHQGTPAPVVSSGLSLAQSYFSHPQPPQVHASTQICHSYPTSEQQCLPWSQNVHQLPPAAPLPGSNAYPLPSSQGPLHLPSSHAPPPSLAPYSSSSSFLTSDPYGSSIRQHSYLQSMGPLPPPPPPPPPPSSPPRVPPLPPSSPPSDIFSRNDGSHSLKDLLDGDNLMLEHPPPVKPAEDRSVNQIEVPCQHTEKGGPKVESVDAVVAQSPTDSDMDMEG